MAGFQRSVVSGTLSWLARRQHETHKHACLLSTATLISAPAEARPFNSSALSTNSLNAQGHTLWSFSFQPYQHALHASSFAGIGQHRGIHSESLYLHHTGGYGRHSDAVPIGLAYALERHEQDIGYFRPIATSQSARGEVMRRVLELEEDNPKEAFAFHQGEVFEYLASGKTDELLERILQAYEKYKRKYKFVLIEGTSFGEVNERIEVDALNARICSMLGLRRPNDSLNPATSTLSSTLGKSVTASGGGRERETRGDLSEAERGFGEAHTVCARNSPSEVSFMSTVKTLRSERVAKASRVDGMTLQRGGNKRGGRNLTPESGVILARGSKQLLWF